MLRTVAITGICSATILSAFAAQSNGPDAAAQRPWCKINPGQAMAMQGRSIQIAQDRVQIVLAREQAESKQRLSNNSFINIDMQEALRLVGNPAAFSVRGKHYLVRASAFYVDEQYNVKSHLEAYVYPEQKVLRIINSSLSSPGSEPADLAIVVETDVPIQRAIVTCLTAA